MLMTSGTINVIYGFLAVIAVLLMIVPTRATMENRSVSEVTYHSGIAMGALSSAVLLGLSALEAPLS